MPGPVIRDPTPDWMRPENASVLDPWYLRGVRSLASLAGLTDLSSQVMGIGMPMELPSGTLGGLQKILPKKIGPGVVSAGEPGYVYHATNAERLAEIAESGKLKTHKPWAFTDQSSWPDGAIEKRAYFGSDPSRLYQFAPEEGKPVILRAKQTTDILRESGTGDLFTRKQLPATALEFLGEDGSWYPVKKP